MRTQRIVDPVDEPMELEEVRMHLRNPEATTNDDELFSMIQTAREWAEQRTGYALMTQTWDVYLDCFSGYQYPYYAAQIMLPYPPLQRVTYMKYLNSAGVLTTVDPTIYSINTAGVQATITLAYGKSWPTSILGAPNSVVIRIVVGWVDPVQVPTSIKNWMKLAIEAMDKNRSLLTEKTLYPTPFADRLLDRYRIVEV